MRTADNAAQRQGAAREGLLASHPLTFYFVIAYAFSWLVWVPLALSQDGADLLSFRSPIGVSAAIVIASFVGPFLSAFILTGITEGREGIGRLVRRVVLWRVRLGCYLFTLIGIPMILVLGVIVLPGALASFKGLASLVPPGPGSAWSFMYFSTVRWAKSPAGAASRCPVCSGCTVLCSGA
jgi:uncharacterized protein